MGWITTDYSVAIKRLSRHTLKTAMTWGDTAANAAVQSLHLSAMQLRDRDYRVLMLVSRFGQLGTDQINSLVFGDSTSRTPLDRSLKRLRNAGLLELVQQRDPGGHRGGSATNIYQLGKDGWSLFYSGRRKVQRAIRYHALAVADVFVQVTHADWLDIMEWQVESDAWVDVAGADLRPDLYLVLDDRSGKPPLYLWVEVDLGGERQKQIIEKLERYKYAYEHSEAFSGDVFPQIVFLCTTSDRVREISQIIARMKDLPDGLVTVGWLPDFPNTYM